MNTVTIHQLAADEATIKPFLSSDVTNHSYRLFVDFFARTRVLTERDVTIGAFFTYGWMPTMLDNFKVVNLTQVTTIANAVKSGSFPSTSELQLLKNSINNSLVGTSKLLHFINPEICSIWDRRVYRYIGPSMKYPPVESITNYLAYHDNLCRLVHDPAFPLIKKSMESKVGYKMSAFRVAEYIMFLKA